MVVVTVQKTGLVVEVTHAVEFVTDNASVCALTKLVPKAKSNTAMNESRLFFMVFWFRGFTIYMTLQFNF